MNENMFCPCDYCTAYEYFQTNENGVTTACGFCDYHRILEESSDGVEG